MIKLRVAAFGSGHRSSDGAEADSFYTQTNLVSEGPTGQVANTNTSSFGSLPLLVFAGNVFVATIAWIS